MRSFFGEALAAAQAQDVSLRLRLAISPGAAELHSLRWETLRLPERDAPLLTGQNLRFSRYLSSLDWRPVRLRPLADLRALVAVAGPRDVERLAVGPVDTQTELAAARAGLGGIAVTELATRGQVTLNNLAVRFREGFDILYLVAHGMLVDGEPWLFLEQADGTARVPGPRTGDPHLRVGKTGPGWPCSSPARAQAPASSRPRRMTAHSRVWVRAWPRRACRR